MTSTSSPIHPDGYKFIGIFAAVALVFFMISQPLGWIGVALTGWCIYFFRNPKRIIPQKKGLIVSPADGIVSLIETVVPPAEFNMGSAPRTRISVFLNVFDVHVNRIPIGGVVEKIIYHPGKFFNASLDKASEFNERQSVIINTGDDQRIAVIQIAGLIARRIRCDIKQEEVVMTGQLYGLIRFGSRADVYLPEGIQPLVIKGQRMIAGETVLADIKNSEPARVGAIR